MGCVFAELLQRERIDFEKSGLLDEAKNKEYNWEKQYGDRLFQNYLNKNDQKVQRYMSGKYLHKIKNCSSFLGKNGRDLLTMLLTYDQEKRIDANNALSHPYVFLWREPAELELEPDKQEELDQEISKESLFGKILTII
jgi:hypothetical protein